MDKQSLLPAAATRSRNGRIKGLSKMDARLTVVSGPFSGQKMQVPRPKLLIGRAEDCNLRPDSEFVSGHHCVLLLDDYTLRIRDLGSKNGTLVNGRRIGTGTTILLHDDMVAVGEMSFLVDLSQTTAGATLADPARQPLVSPTALEGTGVFEGDTLEAAIPNVALPLASPPPVSTPVNPNVSPSSLDETRPRQ
jgi:pSer/pThr/pTyr-binding forkhead associated (FHA) protein